MIMIMKISYSPMSIQASHPPPGLSSLWADFTYFLQIIVKQSEEIHDDPDRLSEIVSWLNISLEESQT